MTLRNLFCLMAGILIGTLITALVLRQGRSPSRASTKRADVSNVASEGSRPAGSRPLERSTASGDGRSAPTEPQQTGPSVSSSRIEPAVRGESTFVNGLREGNRRVWYPNGQLAEEGNHLDGERHGTWRTWNAAGELAAERIEGKR